VSRLLARASQLEKDPAFRLEDCLKIPSLINANTPEAAAEALKKSPLQ